MAVAREVEARPAGGKWSWTADARRWSPGASAAIEALRQWHLTVPLDYYTAIRKRFSDAGLEIYTYEPSLGAVVSDADLNRACEVTKALGAHYPRRQLLTKVGRQTHGADRR